VFNWCLWHFCSLTSETGCWQQYATWTCSNELTFDIVVIYAIWMINKIEWINSTRTSMAPNRSFYLPFSISNGFIHVEHMKCNSYAQASHQHPFNCEYQMKVRSHCIQWSCLVRIEFSRIRSTVLINNSDKQFVQVEIISSVILGLVRKPMAWWILRMAKFFRYFYSNISNMFSLISSQIRQYSCQTMSTTKTIDIVRIS
jgi:hypothetical protein